jgi:trehalose 6-phosphate synthase/phosphatase
LAYRAINEAFNIKISQIKIENDMIWVHDLMLLPRYLRRNDVNINVGLYFHFPLPCYEVFSRFQFASELLRGILFTDVLGFYSFMNARIFIKYCVKMLKLSTKILAGGHMALEFNGRTILIKIAQTGQSNEILSNNVGGSMYHKYKF